MENTNTKTRTFQTLTNILLVVCPIILIFNGETRASIRCSCSKTETIAYQHSPDSIGTNDSLRIILIRSQNCKEIIKLTYRFEDYANSENIISLEEDTTVVFIPSYARFFSLITENDYLLLSSAGRQRSKQKNRLEIKISEPIPNINIEFHKLKNLLVVYRVFKNSRDFEFCYNEYLKKMIVELKSKEYDNYVRYLIIADKSKEKSSMYPIDSIKENSFLFSQFPDDELHSYANNVEGIDSLLKSTFIPVDINQTKIVLLTNFELKNDIVELLKPFKESTIAIFSSVKQDKILYFTDFDMPLNCNERKLNKKLKQVLIQ